MDFWFRLSVVSTYVLLLDLMFHDIDIEYVSLKHNNHKDNGHTLIKTCTHTMLTRKIVLREINIYEERVHMIICYG